MRRGTAQKNGAETREHPVADRRNHERKPAQARGSAEADVGDDFLNELALDTQIQHSENVGENTCETVIQKPHRNGDADALSQDDANEVLNSADDTVGSPQFQSPSHPTPDLARDQAALVAWSAPRIASPVPAQTRRRCG